MRWFVLLWLLLSFEYCDGKILTWRKEMISWTFRDPYNYLNPSQRLAIRRLVADAFGKWQVALTNAVRVVELQVTEKDASASAKPKVVDVDVFFAKKNHSCLENFDGKGGIVAHSGYPIVGILHLDGDERWHTGNRRNGDVDLRYVLLHEIGHVLGLRHSTVKGSVMNRNYRLTDRPLELAPRDVSAIRRLYLPRSKHEHLTELKNETSKLLDRAN